MSRVPLLGHASLDDIFAWREAGENHGPNEDTICSPVSIRDFLAEVAALVAQLPTGRHLLNLCQNRYHFAVGFAAGLLSGKISLQPSSQSAETLHQIKASCPDVFCLCDDDFPTLDLPRLDFPDLQAANGSAISEIPHIAAEQIAARLFTSGSTGLPMPHDKTWGKLVSNGRAEAQRLGLLDTPHQIVGTVPAQHSYGFESTILLAFHGNSPFWAGRPFYPQDIVSALHAVPAPRLLVTTPFHLSAVLAAGLALPPVDLLLSATAPLSAALAKQAEEAFGAPLYEIYGSTESGQIASRRTTAGPTWQLLDGINLEQNDDQTTASGGHVEGRVGLSDIIELIDDRHFLLHGRHTDLINIAGKRTSLAYLNHQISAIPGVTDAAFFLPDETGSEDGTDHRTDSRTDHITRLCAFVVAPGMNNRQILSELRARLDPIFLPRPLFLLDALPRNSTGKLPRSQLQALYAEKRNRAGQ